MTADRTPAGPLLVCTDERVLVAELRALEAAAAASEAAASAATVAELADLARQSRERAVTALATATFVLVLAVGAWWIVGLIGS